MDLAISPGIAPERIDTIADWAAAGRYGAKTDGNMVGARAEVLAELAGLIDSGRLEVPTYPLAEVQDAYRRLEQRHTLGKIVLGPRQSRRRRCGALLSGSTSSRQPSNDTLRLSRRRLFQDSARPLPLELAHQKRTGEA